MAATMLDHIALIVVPRLVKNVAIGVITLVLIHVTTWPTAAHTAFQSPIQKLRNSSEVFQSVMNMVTKVAMAITITPTGFAVMAAPKARKAPAATVTAALNAGIIDQRLWPHLQPWLRY